MNTVANEKATSGESAHKASSAASSGDKPGVQRGAGPVPLPFSWEVAPAQIVAILDLSGKRRSHKPSSLASSSPVASTSLNQACSHHCPAQAVKI